MFKHILIAFLVLSAMLSGSLVFSVWAARLAAASCDLSTCYAPLL